ncbi:hypothetical protein D3C73_1502690 [compost metagenome]
MGISSFILAAAPADLIFDEGTRLVNRLSLADLLEQLNGRLNETVLRVNLGGVDNE